MDPISDVNLDVFDLQLEVVEESASDAGQDRCLRTAYQSTCSGFGCGC